MLAQSNALRIPLMDESVQMCVTSPPYFGLVDYKSEGQIGAESIVDCLGWATGDRCNKCYVCCITNVCAEIWRVLANNGTLWLNLGDSFVTSPAGNTSWGDGNGRNKHYQNSHIHQTSKRAWGPFLKNKDLCGVPWHTALALQAFGWYLRSDIIWAKPNPVPESIRDRPTKGHEYLFLLSKSPKYYYNKNAISEPAKSKKQASQIGIAPSGNGAKESVVVAANRNKRTIWTIPSSPFRGAHFATFPPALVEPCILAGSKPQDIVLDPFCGSGTVGMVAKKLDRRFVGLDISWEYLDGLARNRVDTEQKRSPVRSSGNTGEIYEPIRLW